MRRKVTNAFLSPSKPPTSSLQLTKVKCRTHVKRRLKCQICLEMNEGKAEGQRRMRCLDGVTNQRTGIWANSRRSGGQRSLKHCAVRLDMTEDWTTTTTRGAQGRGLFPPQQGHFCGHQDCQEEKACWRENPVLWTLLNFIDRHRNTVTWEMRSR